jgi:hypothetical protein
MHTMYEINEGQSDPIRNESSQPPLTLWHTNFFCELGGTNRFITLKIYTNCLYDTPFDRSFFQP